MSSQPISQNSFDLLRLLAALQVATCHTIEYLSPQLVEQWWFKTLELFPGVPIFFFISGFLISRSYTKNSNLMEYSTNRALRIFPALHLCVIINLLLIAATGYFTLKNTTTFDIAALYLAKTTFFQFYNPDFMRDFGDGVLNGSLWTICVELQFYILTPILYFFISNKKTKTINIILVVLVILFCILNRVLYELRQDYGDTIAWKLFRVSFFPWFYMFLAGIIVQTNFDFFYNLFSKINTAIAVAAYVIVTHSLIELGYRMDNSISPINYFLLACLVFKLGYSNLSFTTQKLKGNDISYGVYIYHMPFVNSLIYQGATGTVFYSLAAIALSITAGLASWFALEKPCLKLKRRPSNPIS